MELSDQFLPSLLVVLVTLSFLVAERIFPGRVQLRRHHVVGPAVRNLQGHGHLRPALRLSRWARGEVWCDPAVQGRLLRPRIHLDELPRVERRCARSANSHEWSRRESNPRPLECDSSALPTELRPHPKGRRCHEQAQVYTSPLRAASLRTSSWRKRTVFGQERASSPHDRSNSETCTVSRTIICRVKL